MPGIAVHNFATFNLDEIAGVAESKKAARH
jgi:hypothetical protein